MKRIRIGVNGFGRIGRYFTRLALNDPQIELVLINDIAPTATLVHLLKYDSVHRKFNLAISLEDEVLKSGNNAVHFSHFSNPGDIPWKAYDVDVVIESSGLFLTKEKANLHLQAGAKRVVLSAPSKNEDIFNLVLGVNEDVWNKSDLIISNASCTTNSAAPLIQVLKGLCQIESAYITTVHSFTTDQRLHDSPHTDLRRARAASQSIVPTTTGAAKALTRIFPELDGKIGGCGIRVPVPDGSLTDITMVINNPPSVEMINEAFLNASKKQLKGILAYTDEPIVSVDILGNAHSCLFDSELTSVVGNMVKVVAWYDNEAGYANRLVDLVKKIPID